MFIFYHSLLIEAFRCIYSAAAPFFLASSYLSTGLQAVMENDAFHTQSLAMNVPHAIEKFDEWLKHPKNHLQAGELLSLFPSTVKAYAPLDKNQREDAECLS